MYASNTHARPDALFGTTKSNENKPQNDLKNVRKSGISSNMSERLSRGDKTSYPLSPDRSSLIVRPHRLKSNRSLNKTQVAAMIEGGLHAQRIGYPLNRFTTIDWDRAGVIDLWVAQSAFIKYIRDWLRCHKAGPATYVWVIENGPRHGLHSHIMLHVPPGLIKDFNKRQRKWWKQIGVDLNIKGTIHSEHIGHSYWAGFGQGAGVAAYRQNLAHLTHYLAKAADLEARQAHQITHSPQHSDVPGKRTGTSLNIAAKAITKWYQEQQHQERCQRAGKSQ